MTGSPHWPSFELELEEAQNSWENFKLKIHEERGLNEGPGTKWKVPEQWSSVQGCSVLV